MTVLCDVPIKGQCSQNTVDTRFFTFHYLDKVLNTCFDVRLALSWKSQPLNNLRHFEIILKVTSSPTSSMALQLTSRCCHSRLCPIPRCHRHSIRRCFRRTNPRCRSHLGHARSSQNSDLVLGPCFPLYLFLVNFRNCNKCGN